MKTETTAARVHALVTASAQERAASLCGKAIAAILDLGATPAQRARGERYQVEEFQNRKMSERILCDLLLHPADEVALIDTREELLAAIDVYAAAGIAEVRRLFAESGV